MYLLAFFSLLFLPGCIAHECEGQQCVAPPFKFDITVDGTENQRKCAWTITNHHEQKGGSCYLSAAFRAHAFRRCVSNLDAGYEFDENYFTAIHQKSKECVFREPAEKRCGGFNGGYRHSVLEYLARDSDGPVGPVYGVQNMQQEIWHNGVITTGFTVPLDFPYHPRGKPYKPSYRALGEDHAIIIYGWNSDSNGLYWIAANSWASMQSFKIYANLRLGIEDRGLIHSAAAVKDPPQWDAGLVAKFDAFEAAFSDYTELALIGGDFGFGMAPAPHPYHYERSKFGYRTYHGGGGGGDWGPWNGHPEYPQQND